MLHKILVVTATLTEAGSLVRLEGLQTVPAGGNAEIIPLVAGVGSIATAWELQKWISVNEKPDLAINCGIAGSYNEKIKIGDVVLPVADCFADAGVEDGNDFLTLSEAGLTDANMFPFTDGHILAQNEYVERLKERVMPVRAITVNTATGSDATREKLIEKFNPDIETMEGAAFFYICSRAKIPFLSLRAISNMVETRNRHNWDIPLALKNLSETLNDVVLKLK